MTQEGHVEIGESFTDAVIREVKEETGLTISNPILCGTKNWYDENYRYVVFMYKTSQFTGQIHSSEEGEVWWEDFSNLPNLQLATEDMLDMLKIFTEDEFSEFFYFKEVGEWIYNLK